MSQVSEASTEWFGITHVDLVPAINVSICSMVIEESHTHMKYRGVGLKACKANTKANDDSVFSPPERFEICLQDCI